MQTRPVEARPIREPKASEGIELGQREKKTVRFPLDESSMAFCDGANKRRQAELGRFEVETASPLRDIRVSSVYDLEL